MSATTDKPTTNLVSGVQAILASIDQQREQEIIIRRFGLSSNRETLEQIGELLGITRERVRQLEKSILNKLKAAAEEGKIEVIGLLEKDLVRQLTELGRVARIQHLADHLLGGNSNKIEAAHVAFVAELSPNLAVVHENDHYHHSVGIKEHGDDQKIRKEVDTVVETIKKHGEPLTIEDLHAKLNHEHPDHVRAFASVSKHLSNLKDQWGLNKWPTVNPKNIRDKIYVILIESGKPMHFSEIAKSIKDSSFKRKDVTTQAIHNELIKDPRFVLIGRGIYAIDSWGYAKGTVSDIIVDILKKSGQPLHRDEIIRQVLKSRQVKETTILLNLQSKPQFKRVAKATYALQPEA